MYFHSKLPNFHQIPLWTCKAEKQGKLKNMQSKKKNKQAKLQRKIRKKSKFEAPAVCGFCGGIELKNVSAKEKEICNQSWEILLRFSFFCHVDRCCLAAAVVAGF